MSIEEFHSLIGISETQESPFWNTESKINAVLFWV